MFSILVNTICTDVYLLGTALEYAELTGNETEEVRCIGYGEETKPMIMAKVLNPEFGLDLKKVKIFINEEPIARTLTVSL